MTNRSEEDSLVSDVLDTCPDIVGFSTTTHSFPHVQKWAPVVSKALKQDKRHALVICGGVHATLEPSEVISTPGIDVVCIGEGELPLKDLLHRMEEGLPYQDVGSLWFKVDDRIVKNPVAPLIEDLDTLPYADREIFQCEVNSIRTQGVCHVMASRGCPYNCSYCCNHAIKQRYPNRSCYVRFRSVDNLIEELVSIKQRYPEIKEFDFVDDILPLNKKWFAQFSARYRSEISLPFRMLIRPNLVDDEIIGLAKEAGCYQVNMGVESGNENIRNRVLDRHISTEQIQRAALAIKQAGLHLHTYNIIGVPFETPVEVLDTVKLNAALRSDSEQFSIFYPYPGTRLYEVCKREGFLTEQVLPSIFTDTVLRLPGFPRDSMRMFARHYRFLIRVYRGVYSLPSPIARSVVKLADRVLVSAAGPKVVDAIYPVISLLWKGWKFIKHIWHLGINEDISYH